MSPPRCPLQESHKFDGFCAQMSLVRDGLPYRIELADDLLAALTS